MAIDVNRIPKTLEFVWSEPYEEGGDRVPLLVLLDQRKLPQDTVFLQMHNWLDVVDAIKELAVRGAPAIGIVGAASLCMRSAELSTADPCSHGASDDVGSHLDEYLAHMSESAKVIDSSRPTAVSLHNALERCLELTRSMIDAGASPCEVTESLFELVNVMIENDIKRNMKMGAYGADLLGKPSRIVTHCNAGSLATAFFGTALGVIYTAADRNMIEMVYADETRPVDQGSRLTVWELARADVPVTLICDDMTASIMAQGKVDAVFVGADRIASNGDVANKIGTLGVAVLADHFNIPFYVVAPTETIDFNIPDGSHIPIEQRDPKEVQSTPIEGVDVLNPAFDVTPASLITKIITEDGVHSPDDLMMLCRL